jgi:sugar phosphate isomerase/epimerase
MAFRRSDFATSTITWVGRPISIAFQEAKGMGFDRIDICLIQNWTEFGVIDLCERPEEVTESLSGALEREGLRLVALNANIETGHERFTIADQVGPVCELATRLRAESGVSVQAASIRTPFPQVCEEMRPVYSEFRKRGITLLVETHNDRWTQVPKNCMRLIEEFPGLKLTLDASHFIVHGYDVPDWEPLIEHTGHCHLRSCGEKGWEEIQVPVSRCSPKVYDSLRKMADLNYQGSLTLEIAEGFGVTNAPAETRKLLDSICSMGIAG